MEQESCGNYEKTQQRVSNVFLYYIYYYYKSYSKLHVLSMSLLYHNTSVTNLRPKY